MRRVAPPRDLRISDPGLLGSLDVEWKPPPHAQTFNECAVKYKFEYRSTGDRDWKVWLTLTQLFDKIVNISHCCVAQAQHRKGRWNTFVIFTRKLKFRVGFDLSRSAEVRLQTLLQGRCTDDVEVQSDWVYATFQVPPQGKLESEVQNFHCIYHDWEYLKCTWQPGLLSPRGVHYGLYYWYEGLERAAQCSHYIQERGVNVGCVLRNLSQAEYRDLNICVNGSAAATLLRPLYTTLRLHNLVSRKEDKQLFILIPVILSLSISLIMFMLIGQCKKRTSEKKEAVETATNKDDALLCGLVRVFFFGLTDAEPGLPREPERVIVPPRGPHVPHEAQKRKVLAFYLMMPQLLTVDMEIYPNLQDSQTDLGW
ncbi:hypothetical protein DUI87_25256 [Hirundo rustica rustica]|uniref:Type I cytokine receptor cytokine-binding domain-containing protein n=1 Tax=Hirundo rustica rustica TaxID=333673 RepID=A0A3M0JDF7_HIRRU|nr:hypothetical protein DUI87_25256 [Hirundo rustica rustica]